MRTVKKTGTRTSDRVNTGTVTNHYRSHAAVKRSAPVAKNVLHAGQPKSLSGSGFKTGHKGNNT